VPLLLLRQLLLLLLLHSFMTCCNCMGSTLHASLLSVAELCCEHDFISYWYWSHS
jgi:hypothetical protein